MESAVVELRFDNPGYLAALTTPITSFWDVPPILIHRGTSLLHKTKKRMPPSRVKSDIRFLAVRFSGEVVC